MCVSFIQKISIAVNVRANVIQRSFVPSRVVALSGDVCIDQAHTSRSPPAEFHTQDGPRFINLPQCPGAGGMERCDMGILPFAIEMPCDDRRVIVQSLDQCADTRFDLVDALHHRNLDGRQQSGLITGQKKAFIDPL